MTEPERDVGAPLTLDERPLTYSELLAAKSRLTAADLTERLGDGRAIVRANAALGLAALGITGGELVPFLRDADARVALMTAEALAHLGRVQRSQLVAIAAALDGARAEVVDTIQRMFAELVGHADPELTAVLDTGSAIAANAVIGACARAGVRGLYLLHAAARDGRARVRINAVRGIARLGDLELERSLEVLVEVERDDGVSDVRTATRSALAALRARAKATVATRRKSAEPARAAVPELEKRAMTPAELAAAAKVAPLDELLHALEVPRVHARLNAVRLLVLQRTAGAATSRALAVLLRDPEPEVRAEVAAALGKLGDASVVAAALVGVLGDAEPAVIAAAETALAELGDGAAPALVEGLETAREAQGARAATLLGRLADGPLLLREALASTSVDVRIHAALGLGALGKARAGASLQALAGVASGGNARLRAAVAAAIAQIDPKPDRAPPRVAIEGFDSRVLAEQELEGAKPALVAAGTDGLAAHLHDARAAVRANAALALGALGTDALAAAGALSACLRDDAVEVRFAAARALDLLGDGAVAASAQDLVGAWEHADGPLEAQLAKMLRARTHAAIDRALARGLATTDVHHAQRICALVCERPTGVAILCEAFGDAATQRNAARGFVRLGVERIGQGRAVLEAARGDSTASTRGLARATLQQLDGPPAIPEVPAVAGFETGFLEPSAFANAKLDASVLRGFLQDGRAPVRANAVTALGTLGPAAAAHAVTVAALLRDDDDRVRSAAAEALDKLGDDAVVTAAPSLVGALRTGTQAPTICRSVLAARKAKVETALLAGLETSDEAHGMRVAELVAALPNARELLFVAFDGPAQNVQINAAFGIGMLGATGAGPAGRRRLESGLVGPFTRRREAMVKALAIFDSVQPRRPEKQPEKQR